MIPKPRRETAQYGDQPEYGPIDLVQEYQNTLLGLNTTIRYIDSSLELCNRLLDISQPNAPGRVLIVWWKTGKHPHLSPVPVVLKKSWIPGKKQKAKAKLDDNPLASVPKRDVRHKDWYLEKVSVRGLKLRAKQGGAFAESYETTSAILGITKELLEQREFILTKARLARSQLDKILSFRKSKSEELFERLRQFFVLFTHD